MSGRISSFLSHVIYRNVCLKIALKCKIGQLADLAEQTKSLGLYIYIFKEKVQYFDNLALEYSTRYTDMTLHLVFNFSLSDP